MPTLEELRQLRRLSRKVVTCSAVLASGTIIGIELSQEQRAALEQRRAEAIATIKTLVAEW